MLAHQMDRETTRDGDLARASELASTIPGFSVQYDEKPRLLAKQEDGGLLKEKLPDMRSRRRSVSSWTGARAVQDDTGARWTSSEREANFTCYWGQDEAVSAVAAAVTRSRCPTNHPLGGFFFPGGPPASVKTGSWPKALADSL